MYDSDRSLPLTPSELQPIFTSKLLAMFNREIAPQCANMMFYHPKRVITSLTETNCMAVLQRLPCVLKKTGRN